MKTLLELEKLKKEKEMLSKKLFENELKMKKTKSNIDLSVKEVIEKKIKNNKIPKSKVKTVESTQIIPVLEAVVKPKIEQKQNIISF